MEQHEPTTVTHLELLVELRVMQKELSTIKDSIDKVTGGHAQEIKDLKAAIDSLKNENGRLRVQMGQVFAVSALLALLLPILITATSPRVQFGSQQTTQTRP